MTAASLSALVLWLLLQVSLSDCCCRWPAPSSAWPSTRSLLCGLRLRNLSRTISHTPSPADVVELALELTTLDDPALDNLLPWRTLVE